MFLERVALLLGPTVLVVFALHTVVIGNKQAELHVAADHYRYAIACTSALVGV